jgi:uncharacterized membrane protein YdjX (TVP38/TMEM64 family)
MLGKEDCEKSIGLLRDYGTVYFPLMMMFPVFPDDALVMMAGVMKMKLAWFIPSVLIGRSIGIATIIYGMNLIPFNTFEFYDWIVFLTVCLFWVTTLFKYIGKINVKFLKFKKKFNELESQSRE